MEVERNLSIDELFEKVNGYDLVFTAEASLMDALNVRIDEPLLEPFATTPKIYTLGNNQNKELLGERELFIEIVKKTGIPWKKASHILENIVDCWKKTGSPENIKKHGMFKQESVEEILEVINSTENLFGHMEDVDVEEDKEVAVVNYHQFNELDKKVLPENFDEIDVFTGEKTSLPKFKVFDSKNDIVRAVRNNINHENALDVAVVIDSGSSYSKLVESALKSREIPVMRKQGLSEDESLRTFIRFLRLAINSDRVLVGRCQPVMRKIGLEVPVGKNKRYLGKVENKDAEEFKNILEEVRGSTVGEALEIMGKYTDLNLKKEFEDLGILEDKISSELVNRLEYYLSTYTVEVESSGSGVLLADAKSSAYIDRPVVFYLGMDMGWTPDIPDKPWINREKEEKTNFRDFKAMIQNGEQQHFMVRNTSVDGVITPCTYFNELTETEFETFKDLEHREFGSELEEKKKGFEKHEFRTSTGEIEKISKSSLDRFVKCPREFLFDRLTDTVENRYLAMGNILHDFAEFYVNHGEFVKKEGEEVFVDMMLDEMRGFVDPLEIDILETKFFMAVERIREFVEEFLEEGFETGGFRHVNFHGKNVFAERFDREIEKDITEVWFSDNALGMKGKVDLMLDSDHMVDYKTGKMKKAHRVVENSCLQVLDEEPNFQAMMYLAYLRKKRPGEKLKFTFFHIFENLDEEMSGETDIEDDLVNIKYHPVSFEEFVGTRDMFEFIMKKKYGDEKVGEGSARRKTLEVRMDYDDYQEFFRERQIPFRFEKGEIEGSEFLEDFIMFCSEKIGDRYSYVEKGCESALKRIVDYGRRNYFKEDLDRFEDFVDRQIKLLNRFRKDKFPVKNPELDIDIDEARLDKEDMIPK